MLRKIFIVIFCLFLTTGSCLLVGCAPTSSNDIIIPGNDHSSNDKPAPTKPSNFSSNEIESFDKIFKNAFASQSIDASEITATTKADGDNLTMTYAVSGIKIATFAIIDAYVQSNFAGSDYQVQSTLTSSSIIFKITKVQKVDKN